MAEVILNLKKERKEKTVEKVKGRQNEWWVQSSRFPQLYYRTIMRADTNEIYCSCDHWRYNKKTMCRHQMQVLQEELGGIINV